MDSKEFSRVQGVTGSLAQKSRGWKEFTDREFDEAMTAVLKEDEELLERLANV